MIVQTPTPALWTTVAVNASVWLLWQLAILFGGSMERLMTSNFLVSAGRVGQAPWTLLTSAVSHVGLAHLAFNMLALVMFGRDLERIVGAVGFMHLYVAGGIVASAGHVLYGWVTGDAVPALGASGSVMAVLIVSTFLFPWRMVAIFFIIAMPQVMAVTLFVIFDVLGMLGGGGGIAHAAHLGGALYGAIYAKRHLNGYLQERLLALGITRRRPPWAR